jgi:diguanylate cyclase (GGDEF)-like protein
MKRLKIILLGLFVYFPMVSYGFHEDGLSVLGKKIDGTDNHPLKLILGEGSYPIEFLDENGEPAGLLVDLWKEWSLITGTEVVFIARHWQDSLKQIQLDPQSVHVGMAMTPERKAEFFFAKPISHIQSYLYLHSDIATKTQFSELVPFQIGIVAGSAHESSLLKLEPRLTFRRYKNRAALLQGVAAGDVYVFAGIEGYQRGLSLEKDIGRYFSSAGRMAIENVVLAPAIGVNNPELLAKINQGFAKITKEAVVRVEKRWLGYRRQTNGIVIAMQTNVEPFAFNGVDGSPHGLYVDLWRLWSEKTGVNIEFLVSDMADSVKDVRQGYADVHIGYPESAELNTGLKQAWNIFNIKSRLFLHKNHISSLKDFKDFKDLKVLKGQRIGVFPTAPYISKVKQAIPDVHLRFYNSLADMTTAVNNGEISGFIASGALTSHYLLNNKLWSEYQTVEGITFSTDIFSLTRLEDRGLVDRIVAGFRLISAKELNMIEQKWLINPDDRRTHLAFKQIRLSANEQEYIASLGAIKMGYLRQWAPMEFESKDGVFLGINNDVREYVSMQLGLTITPVAYDNWQSLLDDLIKGNIQLLASMGKTTERENDVMFSVPYWPSPWAVVTDLSQVPLFNLNQLTGKRVAVIKGYNLVNQLINHYPGLNLILVDDLKQGLEFVSQGKADMLVEQVITLANELKTGQYPSLKIAVLTDLAQRQSHMALYPGIAPLLEPLNRALNTMDETLQQEIFQKWVSVDLSSDTATYQRYLMISAVVLLVLIIIIVLGVSINRRLKGEISRRRQAENTIRHIAQFDSLTGLPNRSLLDDRLQQALLVHYREKQKFALLFIDLNGFKAINDRLGHLAGDELLKHVAARFNQQIRSSDTLARFGGDEFVLLLNNIDNDDSANTVAEALKNGLVTGFTIALEQVTVSASIGIGIYPDDGDDAIALLNMADKRMYQVKETK